MISELESFYADVENAGKDEAERGSSQRAGQAHQKVEVRHANGEQQRPEDEPKTHN